MSDLHTENDKKASEIKYSSPISAVLICIVGALCLAAGIILLILGIMAHDLTAQTKIIVGVALAISSAPMFALYNIENDIHYMSYQAELQEIDNQSAISYYDASIELMAQQRDALDELVEKQQQLTEKIEQLLSEK